MFPETVFRIFISPRRTRVSRRLLCRHNLRSFQSLRFPFYILPPSQDQSARRARLARTRVRILMQELCSWKLFRMSLAAREVWWRS